MTRSEKIEAMEGVLRRCRTVLGNMAMENEGAIFKRWPVHHEPLRNDARGLLPAIEEALALPPDKPAMTEDDPCPVCGTYYQDECEGGDKPAEDAPKSCPNCGAEKKPWRWSRTTFGRVFSEDRPKNGEGWICCPDPWHDAPQDPVAEARDNAAAVSILRVACERLDGLPISKQTPCPEDMAMWAVTKMERLLAVGEVTVEDAVRAMEKARPSCLFLTGKTRREMARAVLALFGGK